MMTVSMVLHCWVMTKEYACFLIVFPLCHTSSYLTGKAWRLCHYRSLDDKTFFSFFLFFFVFGYPSRCLCNPEPQTFLLKKVFFMPGGLEILNPTCLPSFFVALAPSAKFDLSGSNFEKRHLKKLRFFIALHCCLTSSL